MAVVKLFCCKYSVVLINFLKVMFKMNKTEEHKCYCRGEQHIMCFFISAFESSRPQDGISSNNCM